ncbi:MAG: hypothetical protein PHX34_04460 [Candidatus Shapirobacteria bacterium]|nr:hypothetical protein [Candidatus Shapirobacteria bacterium]
MKLAVVIVITEKDNAFKQVLLSNVKNFDYVDLYFVYGSTYPKTKLVSIGNGNVNIFSKYNETFENMINKTIDAFKALSIVQQKYDYIIRTNMSTLFDFEKLLEFSKQLSPSALFCGPFIGINKKPYISGTCILMTPDIMQYIIKNENLINKSLNEDIALSDFINTNVQSYFTINIKRLDFIQLKELGNVKRIVYHKTFIGDTDIFCFRFKTLDRNSDINLMQEIVNTKFNTDFTSIYKCEEVNEESPEYNEKYSRNIFLVPTNK